MGRIASSLLSTLVVPDVASCDPLYRQIYLKLRDAILAGRLTPGTQIPSSRDLARDLGVARNTVLNAVGQLITEGYLQGEHGSGTYVNPTLPDDTLQAPHFHVSPGRRIRKGAPFSLRRKGLAVPPTLLPSAGQPVEVQGLDCLLEYSFTRSLRNEGRNWPIGIERPTACRQIGQRVPVLLLTTRQHGQHGGHKPTPTLTLRAITHFAPQDGMPELSFYTIICGFNPFHPHERPQCSFPC
jgi:DNA-binding transcriptional regulator YhcF (GntR family)